MKTFISELPCLRSSRLVLKPLTIADAGALREMTGSTGVYRYLPTFLFEKKYADAQEVIRRLYGECLNDSLILGVFMKEQFCGLAEVYGYRAPIHKISVGYRFLERCWGRGIATETLGLMIDYLLNEKGIEIITASTMIENEASAGVLMMNDFTLVVHAVEEDWGYEKPTIADKWIR